MLIAGDIGGTKTELTLFSNEAGPHFLLAETKVHSADYASLQVIVLDFLTTAKKTVDGACFAVAGPVIGGRVKTTNLPWVVDETALAQALKLEPKTVHLINDLDAWPGQFLSCGPATYRQSMRGRLLRREQSRS